MPKFVVLLSVAFLSACAAYKIERNPDMEPLSAPGYSILESNIEITQSQLTKFPEGFQCFEPMLYFLSVGIIPSQCVDRFIVSTAIPAGRVEKAVLAEYVVTRMQGWVALLLPLLPTWRFGYGGGAETEIKKLVLEGCK